MRNIWNSKKRLNLNMGVVWSSVLLLATLLWGVEGINNALRVKDKQEKAEIVSSIEKAVLLCYSIEGSYPQNLEYLIENYGLTIDTSKYVVHYDVFASNIAPEIEVFDMSEE